MFETVVEHRWQQVHFFSKHFSSTLNLKPYQYKMIRGVDFYRYVTEEAQKHSNIHFIYGNVEAVGNEGDQGLAIVDGTRYVAAYVFNSILFSKPAATTGKHYLLQHFKGLLIETNRPAFNPAHATLMDFRVSQKYGTTFAYVLPFSENRALVEYTLFTAALLGEDEYRSGLLNYIANYLKIDQYSVAEEEFGIIPMTNIRFVKRIGRMINIGTAGGQTKGSSGYTFQFIQKHSDRLVADLVQYGYVRDEEPVLKKRFDFYDSTFLNILSANRHPGDEIFADLFGKNPTDRVLRFLDNESTFEDEIHIMATLPKGVFLKAALNEIFK